ncbi:hypothetical protein Tco_1266588, partial [Tanacetum coccineum]
HVSGKGKKDPDCFKSCSKIKGFIYDFLLIIALSYKSCLVFYDNSSFISFVPETNCLEKLEKPWMEWIGKGDELELYHVLKYPLLLERISVQRSEYL